MPTLKQQKHQESSIAIPNQHYKGLYLGIHHRIEEMKISPGEMICSNIAAL